MCLELKMLKVRYLLVVWALDMKQPIAASGLRGLRDVLNDQNKKQEQRREKNRTKKLHKRWLEV